MKAEFAAVKLSDEQVGSMADIAVKKHRDGMSPEAFDAELQKFWEGCKQARIAEIENGSGAPSAPVASTDPDEDSGSFNAGALPLLPIIAVAWGFDRLSANVNGMACEPGAVAKVIRGTTGVSIKDIEAYGLQGGENSFARVLVKAAPVPFANGTLLGGENSVFRKNLGIKW